MPAATLPDIAKAEVAIVEMTNAFRQKNGLAAVAPDPKLVNAARAYARYLARTGRFAHEADGRRPAERVETAGYRICYVAENLALNQSSAGFETRDLARRMVEGWINSPGHRKNMLSTHAHDTGVAIAKGPDKDPKYIAVQLFGRPKSMAYEFQVSNASSLPIAYAFGGESHELQPGLGIVHTACLPGEVVFTAAGTGPRAQKLKGRYVAKNGDVYTIKPAPQGGVRIVVGQKERIQ
jgi:hypothetical protein